MLTALDGAGKQAQVDPAQRTDDLDLAEDAAVLDRDDAAGQP